MSTVITNTGDALRDTFRAWHAEHDSVDAQLRESLDALAAYQSHLDEWQQQLTRERDELHSSRQQFYAERDAAQADRCHVDAERAQLQSELEQIARERNQLRASREALENEQAQVASQRADAEQLAKELLSKQQQLDCRENEVQARQTELDRVANDLESSRCEVERFRAESVAATEQIKQERAEIRGSAERLERERHDLSDARSRLARESDELEAARRQLGEDRDALRTRDSATEASLKVELQVAREKISSLTDSLLSRTEELRSLDIRRAEAVAELELVRAREIDLKSALDEHKHTAELDRLNWTAEVRQLHDLLQRRPETTVPISHATGIAGNPAIEPAHPASSDSTSNSGTVASKPVSSHGNPVLGSIVQQFDKLRQQRASDRNSSHKLGNPR